MKKFKTKLGATKFGIEKTQYISEPKTRNFNILYD